MTTLLSLGFTSIVLAFHDKITPSDGITFRINMTDLPLITAFVLESVAKIMGRAVGSRGIRKAFETAEIPLRAVRDRRVFIPYKAVALMIEHGARSAGERHMGLQIGLGFAFKELGTYGRYVTQAPTLQDAIQRAARGARFVTNSERYGLEALGDQIRITYDSGVRGCVGSRHVDLSSMLMLIYVVRQFVGEAWHPSRVELDYPRDASESQLEDVFQAPIIFGSPSAGIVLDADLLGRTNVKASTIADHATFGDLRQMVKSRPQQQFVEIVREVMRLRILDGSTDIEGLAQQLRLGPRTLQRRLDNEGTTYRRLIQEVRFERASALLLESPGRVTDIATQLGYSSPGQFVRAFHRWTGQTPGSYRQHHML